MRSRLSLRLQAGLAAAAVALVPTAAMAAGGVARDESPSASGFHFYRAVTITQDASNAPVNETPVAVDPVYGVVSIRNSRTIDLIEPSTLQVSSMPTGATFLPASATVDPVAHRFLMGSSCSNCASGQVLGPVYGNDPTADLQTLAPFPTIQIVDLAGSQTKAYTFTSADGAQAGQSVIGMRSYTWDGHHYLIAMLYFTDGDGSAGPDATVHKTTLVALDEDKMLADPAHAHIWNSDLPNCVRPAANARTGMYLGVGSTGDYLYFACQTLQSPSPTPTSIAGPSAAMRVDLMSPDPAQQDPTKFDVESFPFSADFTFGHASGDPVHDELYLLTGGATGQHYYVFDAAHRSFTGSVPLFFSSRGGTNVIGAAADPSTGRAYLVVEDFTIFVPDATAVPVLHGSLESIDEAPTSADAPPVFDPATHRLFVPGLGFCKPNTTTTSCSNDASQQDPASFHVFEDDTPPPDSASAADPDAGTHQVDEVPGQTPVTYRGFASSYGARLSLVGGAHGTQFGGFYDDLVTAAHLVDPSLPNLPDTDHTVYLGQVGASELSDSAATSSAAPVGVDETSTAEAGGLQSYLNTQLPPPPDQVKQATAPVQDQVDKVSAQSGGVNCSDYGDSPKSARNGNGDAAVYCSKSALKSGGESEAFATAPVTLPGGVEVSVATVASWTTLARDAAAGTVATATGVARGLHITVPGAGQLSIGEVMTTATSNAHGRTGTAQSGFDRSVRNVLVTDDSGKPQFSCGFTDACDPRTLVAQLDAQFPGRLAFQLPDPDSDPSVAHSPGGAQAEVIKSPYEYWNDYNTSHDDSHEIPGLQVLFLNDFQQPSRMILSLAGVHVESHYEVGTVPPPPPPLPAPTLSLQLTDGSIPAAPLSGGTFVLQGPDGVAPQSCTTAADGIGDCTFTNMQPGDYTIHEASAPPGFATSPDYPLSLEAGQAYSLTFVNLPAIGSVNVSLSSAGDSAGPLAGGAFSMFAGSSILGEPVATCTTDSNGECSFDKVPLGDYTMHQVSAPDGYLVSDDAPFSLTEPGQRASLNFIDGTPGVAGEPAVPPAPPTFIPGTPAIPPHTEVIHIPGKHVPGAQQPDLQPMAYQTSAVPPPVVQAAPSLGTPPIVLGGGHNPIAAAARVTTQLARLFAHSPQQAVLLLFVWIVLGLPVYLFIRRRQFIVATERA